MVNSSELAELQWSKSILLTNKVSALSLTLSDMLELLQQEMVNAQKTRRMASAMLLKPLVVMELSLITSCKPLALREDLEKKSA